MTLLEAARTSAKWMRMWLETQECDCDGGHVCGRQERLLELEQIEKAIRAEEDRQEKVYLISDPL